MNLEQLQKKYYKDYRSENVEEDNRYTLDREKN